MCGTGKHCARCTHPTHLALDKKKKLQLHLRWMRGHKGDVENVIADRLAERGTRPEMEHFWWKRARLKE